MPLLLPSLLLPLLVGCGQPPPPPPGPGPSAVLSDAEPPTMRLLPGVEELPANALVFELHWSKPMRLGPHATHVIDAQGGEVPGAIPELTWDAPIRVSTVVLRGLEPGQTYTLRVDGFVSSDGGVALPADHRFGVLPADETPPDGQAVQVRGRPLAGTTEDVTVRFPEPMHHSVVSSLTVLAGPAPWEGAWALSADQTTLTFSPSAPWPAEPVRVSIGGGATDLAGHALVNLAPGLLTPMVEVELPAEPAPSPE